MGTYTWIALDGSIPDYFFILDRLVFFGTGNEARLSRREATGLDTTLGQQPIATGQHGATFVFLHFDHRLLNGVGGFGVSEVLEPTRKS